MCHPMTLCFTGFCVNFSFSSAFFPLYFVFWVTLTSYTPILTSSSFYYNSVVVVMAQQRKILCWMWMWKENTYFDGGWTVIKISSWNSNGTIDNEIYYLFDKINDFSRIFFFYCYPSPSSVVVPKPSTSILQT